MKIRKDDFFVSVVEESLKDKFHELDINSNLEVPLFCIPDILDGNWLFYVKRIKSLLSSNGLICGMHGPFNNLAYHSKDPLVRGVADCRMRQGLEIATALDAKFIVFHSTYSQFVAVKDYNIKWPKEAVNGLQGIVNEAEERGIPIVMENIWDDSPLALKGLLDILHSDYLKACIDIGHFNIFSKVPLAAWFETLSEDIAHFHIHNNFGIIDDHNSLLEGTIDFKEFFHLVALYKIKATFTLEVEKLESVYPSIQYLNNLGVLDEF